MPNLSAPRLSAFLNHFVTDEKGATSIEYALIAILVSLAVISGATALGQALVPVFNSAAAGMAG